MDQIEALVRAKHKINPSQNTFVSLAELQQEYATLRSGGGDGEDQGRQEGST